ncbi:hypothetical protein F9K84_09450 [Brucella anthropi]|uniref:hypothetical protein n=1 Tax=Brucella anthropi TaxID=529 RepID=UPI00124DED04|nr:hypothetical protein [Brucella anthropi]KAB2769468.1 hypothetical protein F9K84_09450 [Brucella anthropi]
MGTASFVAGGKMNLLSATLDFFNQGWVGVVVGLCFGLLAIYQTLKKTEARPSYVHSGQKLIASGGGLLPNEVTVQFDGETVPQISLTLISFWNRGNQTISGGDIAENYPLTFSFKDGEVLKAEVIKLSRDPVEAIIDVNPENNSEVVFSFSFLDPSDGFVLKILHTSEITTPTFKGTIKGIPKGVQHLGRTSGLARRGRVPFARKIVLFMSQPSWFSICLFTMVGIQLAGGALYYEKISALRSSSADVVFALRFIAGFLAVGYFGLAIQAWTRKKVQAPNSLNIDGL